MHTLPLIAGLSLSTLVAALQGHAHDQTASCSRSPLILQDQQTCPAAAAVAVRKEPAAPVIKIEPELWNDYDERYRPDAAYTLPPGWEGPDHCAAEFCLYSSREAAGGDGMVLVTTARNAYLAAAQDEVPPLAGVVEPTAFYEAPVPGKGIGLIANRTIRRGEVIMQRVPAMLIQATPHLDLDPDVREDLYRAAVDRLPTRTRDRFLRQMGDTVYDKAEKNAFRMFLDGDRKYSAHLGVFPEISRFNHDCRPKCVPC